MSDAPIITRGGFLRGILAAGVAPAIIPDAQAHSVAGLRRGLALRQAMAGGGGGPHTYLDFLHIGDGQYLDTNWKPTVSSCKVDTEFRITALSSIGSDCYFGSRNGSNMMFLRQNGVSNVTIELYYTNRITHTSSIPFFALDFIRFHFKGNDAYIGNNKIGTVSGSYSFAENLFVGAMNYQNSSAWGKQSMADFRYFKCFDALGNIAHFFRPVLRHADSRYCFFDEIGQTYHYSVSGGDFTPPT